MVVLSGGELQDSRDVLVLEVGVVGENLVSRGSSGEKVEHILDAHPHASDARPPSAHRRVNRDPVNCTHGVSPGTSSPAHSSGQASSKFARRSCVRPTDNSTCQGVWHGNLRAHPKRCSILPQVRMPYEALEEKGAVMLVSSGAVEPMGTGELMGASGPALADAGGR